MSKIRVLDKIWKSLKLCSIFAGLLLVFFLPSTGISAQSINNLRSGFINSYKPRVLVLHSYHYGFTWSDSISKGIRSVFEERKYKAELLFEFMDTRRIASEEYFQELKSLYKVKYRGRPIDVIICSDDHALNFMLNMGEKVFPDVPIVFCSVSGYNPSMRKGRQLTGLIESIDIKATLDVALKLHPGIKEVAVITDMTRTGRALKTKADKVFLPYQHRLRFKYLEGLVVEDLWQQVSLLSNETIIFLFIFSRDKAGHVFSHEENLENLDKYSKVPIYAVWEFYLGHGIVGGKLTSGTAEGNIVGKMALRILDGEKASDIPPSLSPVQYMFDYNQMKRFNVKESMLPENSIIINKPFSFYKKYKLVVWTTILIFLILVTTIIILNFNIFKRKRAEEALQESEKRYRLLADNVTDVIWIRDMNLNLTYISPSVMNQLGYTIEEAKARTVEETWTPESLKYIEEVFAEELEIEKNKQKDMSRSRTIEVESKCKDGSTIWTEAKMSFLRDLDGRPTGIIGVTRNITERKTGEEALRESESKFRNLFDLSPQAVALTELKSGRLIDVNNKFCELTKYSKEEILGLSTTELGFYHEADRNKLLKELQTSVEVSGLEMEFKAKDNSILHALVFARIIQIEGESFILTICHDVTEQKRLEVQLQQAHKMEAIGTLAGGIAHDFNNILGIILGNTELAMDDVPEWNPAWYNLKEARIASLRAKDVVRQLLSFARKSEVEKKPTNIIPIIKESLELMRSSIPTSIEISQNIPKNIDTILADPTQIAQVLINLSTNADHAMPDGGILEVSLKNVELDKDTAVQYPDLGSGRYVNLTVSDTGHGISQEEIDRIFDPYFTTKEVGKGTGMGLAVVHGIVKGHNGTIIVESEAGKGTTFSIFFPTVEEDPVIEFDPTEKLPTGNEKILFIDDEPSIVNMARQMLERLGYEVVTKISSIEALELFRSKPDQFDLIITDMTMPSMTGDKLVKEILNIRPDMPTIISTGFSDNIDADKIKEIGTTDYFEKPFDKRSFAIKVRSVLDGKKV